MSTALQIHPIASGTPAAMQVAARAQAETLARYALAAQCPRNRMQVRADFLRLCETPNFAERAEYSVPRGKTVSGPSIRFVEGLVQCTPHFDWDASVLAEEVEYRIIRVRSTDLQTNRSEAEDIVVRKVVERSHSDGREVMGQRLNSSGQVTYIVRATEDELEPLMAARISKAKRRTALRLLDRDLVREGLEVAKKTRQNKDAAHPDEARRQVADGFGKLGVPPGELAEYVGHDLASCSPGEIDDLRTLYRAIKDRETTWPDELKARRAERMTATAGKRTLDDLAGGGS